MSGLPKDGGAEGLVHGPLGSLFSLGSGAMSTLRMTDFSDYQVGQEYPGSPSLSPPPCLVLPLRLESNQHKSPFVQTYSA